MFGYVSFPIMFGKDHNLDQLKKWIDEGQKELRVTGLAGTARVYFLARLLEMVEVPSLIILPRAKDAHRFFRELQFFLPDVYVHAEPGKRRLYDFPLYDISPLTGLSPHKDVVTRRLQALYAITSEKNPIVITSVGALCLRLLPKNALIDAVEYLEVEEEVERDKLIRELSSKGYLRTSLVEEKGDFSVRGGVIDVFPTSYPQPVRIEFWGDRIESIRYFDPMSQRSKEDLKEVVLLPANEIIMEKGNVKRARSMGRLPPELREQGAFPGQEAWLNHFYSRLGTFFHYFPHHGLVTSIDSFRIEKETENFVEDFEKDAEKYRQEAVERESPFPELDGITLSNAETDEYLSRYQRLDLSELPIEAPGGFAGLLNITGYADVGGDLDLKMAGKGRVSMAPLAEKITQWLELGARVVLVCRTEQQAKRLNEILNNYQVPVDEVVNHWDRVSPGRGLTMCLGRLSKGFAWSDLGIYVISEDEIFGTKRARARLGPKTTEGALALTAFSQLKAGELVVHHNHGIGCYRGLLKMEVEQKVNDFVFIEYANQDKLFIPADRISILQKYVGADERTPKLDQLGGRSWDLVKKKAKKSIREIAKQLVEIYALRKHRKGFAFSLADNAFREFEATFEHEETSDQIKTIDEVLSDMESDQPMDRLVCGDVGFGKTEVAIRAAFKAVMDGKQAALLVPTTVLAEQHYETFRKRMKPYQLRVEVLSRFKTRAEQKETIAKIRSGKADVLIGTHRILQKDVGFKDLGLLIIDEEQRFGVKQKERLKQYRALVDVLALTATPIPRTMHLSLMGIRDLSIIETPPEDRLAIQTYLSPYDEATIIRAIEFEGSRGGQVFFVHNRVHTINHIADKLKQLVPKARFAIAHGQMKERELEETMVRFLQREIDVLVCTTIIESGLDIPSANTIIINAADRFGLAQIYQLRGRVGRANEVAYAYLLLSPGSNLTPQAAKRLRALMDFSHLGAGFHLAMHDLRIRGGGNILGFSQTGHISAIGYELYLKLIEQSIAELKGEDWHEEINPEINVGISAYLPSDYISDNDVRLNLYRRLSGLKEDEELAALIHEMDDRFGPPGPEVSNLLSVMSVRLLMKRLGILRLDVGSESLVFAFASETGVEPERVIRMVEKNPNKLKLISDSKLSVKTARLAPLDALHEVKIFLSSLEQNPA